MSTIGLQSLAAFSETVRQGSFAGAARALGLTPSAVAKSVGRLEADLGLRLLHRTTREVSLTSDGRNLYQRCQGIVEAIDALRAEAEGVRDEPAGTLRISVPITFGKQVLVPVLAKLVGAYPKLGLDVSLTDRFVDIVNDGYDAAVRVGPLRDSTLVAREFARMQLVTAASRGYLGKYGRPASPRDLAQHGCLVFRQPTSGRPRPWQFIVDEAPFAFTPEPRVVMDDGEAMVAAAVDGAGIVQVPDYMAHAELRRGALVEVLKAARPPSLPVSIVYAGSRFPSPRLRVLVEALTGTKALYRQSQFRRPPGSRSA